MPNSPPDLDSLRCFAAAADTLNFRAAAGRVALSPGAFSERIKRLEEDLGASLFHRTTRQVRLSEEGRRLLPHARAVLDEAMRCRDVVHGHHRPLPYELVVGTRYELGLSWLCPALTDLRRARPERTLHLYMGDTPDLLSRVERGDLDAVVSSARLTRPHLEYAALHREEYVFVGSGQQVRGPDDARELTLLDVSADLPLFRYLLDALPEAEPWPFARHEYLGGIGGIRYRVLEGVGVAVMPRYFVQRDLEAGRLQALLPELQPVHDTFRLVWRSNHPRDEALRDLAEELRNRPLQ